MIEFQLYDARGGWEETGWLEATPLIEVENINFNRGRLRIDGVVYTSATPEFLEAFEKAKIWMMLRK